MLKCIKETLKTYKLDTICIILSLVGMSISLFSYDKMDFIFWMAYFVLCINNLTWNINNGKIKKLQDKIEYLENKLK